jgi:hypothetical protein
MKKSYGGFVTLKGFAVAGSTTGKLFVEDDYTQAGHFKSYQSYN